MMRVWYSSFARDVGFALLHSVWQIVIVAGVFAVAYRLVARGPATVRYWLAYATLLVMFSCPLLTLMAVVGNSPRSEGRGTDEVSERATGEVAASGQAHLDTERHDGGEGALSRSSAEILPARAARAASDQGNLREEGRHRDLRLRNGENWVLPCCAIIWAFGVLSLSIRPLLGFQHCRQLRKQAQRIEFPWLAEMLQSYAERIGVVCTVEIASSALVQVPTLIGWLRPMILLPVSLVTGQTPAEISAILAHELAHIRRNDFALNVCQVAIETLLFYHPGVWWVSAVVREEREHCCDDMALRICGRQQYVAALAKLEMTRSGHADLALAASGGSVYRRIHRLVRSQESASPWAGVLAAGVALSALMLAMAATFALSAAAVVQAGQPQNNGDTQHRPSAEVPRTSDADALPTGTRIFGRMLDVEGQGLRGTLHLVEKTTGFVTQPGKERVLRSVAADEQGRFDFVTPIPPRDPMLDRSNWNSTVLQLVAVAAGHGPAVCDLVDTREGKPVELRLPRDNVPIEGTILAQDGTPVAGAEVRVVMVDGRANVTERLESLRQTTGARKPGTEFAFKYHFPLIFSSTTEQTVNERSAGNLLRHSQFASQAAMTDSSGKFELTGVGRDRLIAIEVSGPSIATRWISVVSREMEPIDAALFIGGREPRTYGAKFTYMAEPSRPIVGRIADAETGAPLAGVLVESTSGVYVSSVTDADGRYRLTGVPQSERIQLDVTPATDMPYLCGRDLEVLVTETNQQEVTADLQLKRTRWYTGRIIDKATGRPVSARVIYSPRRDNMAAAKYGASMRGAYADDAFDRDGNSVTTEQDGRFRIRVIDGMGLLCVRCDEPVYCSGVGADMLTPDGNWWWELDQRMTNTFQPMLPAWTHRLWPINVDEKSLQTVHEITVDPGQTLKVQMVDVEGQGLSGVTVVDRLPWALLNSERPTESDRITIPAITADKPRVVLFYHEQQHLAAALVVPAVGSASAENVPALDVDSRTVRLRPCATVKGRLVDGAGKPLAQLWMSLCLREAGDEAKRHAIAMTDENGWFVADRVVPNTPISIHEMSTVAGVEVLGSVTLQPGEVRDLGELKLTIAQP